MALSDILKHIQQKADAAVAEINKSSEAELGALHTEWEKKFSVERERLIADAEKMASSKLAQAKFKIREKAHTEELLAKQEIIEQVYSAVLERLSKLSDDAYNSMLEKLLEPVRTLDGELFTSKAKHDALKNAARTIGVKAHVSDTAIETVGGFIFRSKKEDLDSTFETLLSRVKEDSLIEVNELVFKE